jgi:hypothetical protein
MLTNTQYKRLAASQGLTLLSLSEMVLGAGAYWSDEALIRGVRQLLLNQAPPLPKAPKRVSLTDATVFAKAAEAKQKFDNLADQVIDEIGKWNPQSQPWDFGGEERCHCDLCRDIRSDEL